MKTHWLAVALLFAAAGLAHADVKLPAMFADNMVLQADAKIPVFGTAAPNEAITVTLGAKSAKTQAGADGKWRVELDPLPASYTPLQLEVSGTNHLTCKNVLIGEVWICSGQSNMYFNLAKDDNAATEVPKATDPNLRLLKVPEQAALQPQDDLRGRWMVCDPKSVGAFSAVAYYFGRQLRQKLDRPVGLIESAWGGSSIQAWMSIDALQKAPPFTQDIAVYQKWLSGDAAREAAYPQQFAAYNAALKKWQAEVEAPYQATLVHWQSDDDTAKQNHQPEPSKPAPPRGPPKPLPPGGDRSIFTTPFNAMIAPLLHCGFKGVLWYQGESNAGPRANEYGEMLARMITDWRARAGRGDFPFLVVQIPLYGAAAASPIGGTSPYVRDGELHALHLPNTGLAVALDQGLPHQIHPPHKIEVGRRLSLWALDVAYGQTLVDSGPIYSAMKVEGNRVRISFRPSSSGLIIGPTSGGDSPIPSDHLQAFAVAGSDRKWVAAEAVIDGATVVVKSKSVLQPVAVRYAWNPNPPANLWNQTGLPASPFRTDTWIDAALNPASKPEQPPVESAATTEP